MSLNPNAKIEVTPVELYFALQIDRLNWEFGKHLEEISPSMYKLKARRLKATAIVVLYLIKRIPRSEAIEMVKEYYKEKYARKVVSNIAKRYNKSFPLLFKKEHIGKGKWGKPKSKTTKLHPGPRIAYGLQLPSTNVDEKVKNLVEIVTFLSGSQNYCLKQVTKFASGMPLELIEAMSDIFIKVLDRESRKRQKPIPPEKLKEIYDDIVKEFKDHSESRDIAERKLDEEYSKKLKVFNEALESYRSGLKS